MLWIKGKAAKSLMANILIMLFAIAMFDMFFVKVYARGENDTKEAELVTSDTTEVFFEDVIGHWAERFINAAAREKLFEGDIYGRFNPDDNITRAQFVEALWRMAGSPGVNSETTFTDLQNQTDDVRSAVAWAYNSGYIDGIDQMTFAPDAPLTREAAMKILHLYSGDTSTDALKFSMIYNKTFLDSDDISDWAVRSMYWGLYNGLIQGTSETTLTPKGMITRAQSAKILVKYMEVV